MKRCHPVSLSFIGIFFSVLLITGGLANPQEKGKIPITTKSEEARKAFLQGRDLFEKLRAQNSRQYFEQAVAKDPDFALAYLFLANAQPTAKGFFENLDKAAALTDKVSEGEKWWIMGAQAGATGNPAKQGEIYRKLCDAYPDDERAHTLLGNYYFGLQEYAKAIEAYEKSVKLNPGYSQPYNQLGYAYRFLEKYDDAEETFKKYVELIPDDPNPYDSYAELLMKIGRYAESIQKYQDALKIDPQFVASHTGIATNLNFMGKHDEARKQLQKLYDIARDDGERRAAYFSMAVSYADEGKMDKALEMLQKQYAIAEKIKDAAAMSGDLTLMGNILIEMGKFDEAKAKYDQARKIVQESTLSAAVKENNRRLSMFNSAYVALMQDDLAAAKETAEALRKDVYAINNRFQIWLAHQAAGMIALQEKNYDKALEELRQANQQDPHNLYRMALAYQGKGDLQQARAMFTTVANHNTLNSMNYAFVRTKAKQMVTTN